MRTVICHFRNEEYLLPWWLVHHRQMFDHGILIDYRSTDLSVDICRDIVPHWEIRATQNSDFESNAVDAEVMETEREISGWKIALNATEFLCADLDALEGSIDNGGHKGAKFFAAALIDPPSSRDVELDAYTPLVQQRYYGFPQTSAPTGAGRIFAGIPDQRSRLFHRHRDGCYGPGRHSTSHQDLMPGHPANAILLWCAYAPWTPSFRLRKLDTNAQRNPVDPYCPDVEHLLEQQWTNEMPRAVDLRTVSQYVDAMAAWNTIRSVTA